MGDLPKRALSGAILIAVALAALWLGGIAFWLLVVVAALLMMAEWSELHGVDARTKRVGQLAISVPLAILAPIASGPTFLVLGLVAGAGFFIAATTRRSELGWGTAYVGLPALALVLLRAQDNGLLLASWALALVWATDIGAYFAGRSIGGAKLAPRISPNKTWAGLIGGVVAATLFAFALHVWAGLPFRLVMATPVLAVTAQAGDLYESWLKRRAGVKDSGSLLPGHGGVLDRLDGLVPVAVLAALLVEVPRWL
ncbi:phosphatidate cytidylyltransferase [Sphingomonas guangdongensis]|uniref:Phosphatidate cytidylyltransferase n=1 Tax=Sphingomonas guangdongensis TaxID=1141890 RepID=A0A285R291_9SPHN|nr:phosphatidate cytidylyltransferase [Sphingomonas guangdongensis]SOB87839.1 phosphatidate cytidylyltransferase [Sphingomonas guangdongensis]